MNRKELIAYDKWLTENKWGGSEIVTPEQAADLYLAEHPLPPAEGAEKSCLSCRFHNSPTYHDKMWCRDCQQLSHYEQQPTAEGADWYPVAKRVLNGFIDNVNTYQDGDELYIKYDTAIEAMREFELSMHEQPTAEGAEEILLKHGFFVMTHKEGSEHVRKVFIEPVIAAMQEFATLHAQRTAEKMVSERMKKVESLLNMAAGLVGNPCTNISSSCDIACDDWQGEYNEYLKSKEK